ncbi:MAG TPA: radical SAM protein, partial [Candidatus Nanoarchaeia archaeon]|nr:radical SAM protein [Candidatus Nanoarchaeia archaeon]
MRINQMTGKEQAAYNLAGKMPGFLLKAVIPSVNNIRVKRLNSLKTPLNLVFYVTDKCNARCEHCFYWKNINKKGNELGLEEIKHMIKSLKHPLELVILTGGEPLLRKDLYEICDAFYTINNTERINVATNGFFAEKIIELAESLMKKHPKKKLSILISVDGLEKTHDRIRGVPGIYKRAIETAKKLSEMQETYKGLTVFINTTIFKANYHQLKELNDIVKGINVIHKFNVLRDNASVRDINPAMLNDFDPKSSVLPEFDKLEEAYTLIKERAESLPERVEALKIRYSIDMLKDKKMMVRCLAGLTDGVVFA